MRIKLSLCLLIGCLCNPTVASAENWNFWRGPDGSGSSQATKLPLTWSQSENVVWKTAVPGKGSSTPIIWEDKIFILTAVETDRKAEAAANTEAPAAQPERDRPRGEGRPGGPPGGRRGGGFGGFGGAAPTNYYQFIVLCYNRKTGEKIWEQVATEEVPHESGHQTNTFASASAVTDGKHVYADFGSRGIFCYDMDGKKVWDIKLGKMRTRNQFGEGSTPAIYGDTLIVPWDQEENSMLYALDAATGKEKWKVQRDEPTTWATPLIVEHKGVVQVITNGTRIRSYDLKDGSLIWECGDQVQNPIPTPVLFEDHVIVMTGYRGDRIHSISLDAKGDVTGSKSVAWTRDDAAPYVPSPALYKGVLYFCKQNNAVVSSVDAKTGEVIIKPSRVEDLGTVYSSPVGAADRIYYTGRDGTTVVIEHGKELKVLATNRLNETVDSSLAIVDNQIFIRTDSTLYCIGEKL